MGLDIQQLQGCDPGFTGYVLQDFQSWPAVLVKFGADVQQGLPRPAELLPGYALVQLLPWHALALLQKVEVVPEHTYIPTGVQSRLKVLIDLIMVIFMYRPGVNSS